MKGCPNQKMKDCISIAFASSDFYAPYLGVSIKSLIVNSRCDKHYNIFILDNGISENNKHRLKALQTGHISINFVDMNEYLGNIDNSVFYIYPPYTVATYLRFFLPEVFPELDRILYIDSDTIIEKDVADLFYCDLDESYLAAVEDFEVKRIAYNSIEIRDYLQNALQLKKIESYFQAGVLLFNLKKMRETNFTEQCFEMLSRIGNPMFLDQCVLNAICGNSYVRLNPSWNVEWHLSFQTDELENNLDAMDYSRYSESFGNPFIIHYTSKVKPWNAPDFPLADRFWNYARLTPFYEGILFSNIVQNAKSRNNSSKFNFKLNKMNLASLISRIVLKLKRLRY